MNLFLILIFEFLLIHIWIFFKMNLFLFFNFEFLQIVAVVFMHSEKASVHLLMTIVASDDNMFAILFKMLV
jgi:hypothetical protein